MDERTINAYRYGAFETGGKLLDKEYTTALGIVVKNVSHTNPKLAKYKTKTGIKLGEIKDLGKQGVIDLARSVSDEKFTTGGKTDKTIMPF